ncbi:hypothetical protein HPP92_011342 [Vanilla planifolia]|uniref:Telomerase reverse transcriptase n=1 Tax=Vanilla planifolia TaxID=51239 RepID=A0A835QXE7_VANPL|nr:hypothetical protein HPP92_011342 [Vanilla planifolia]
MVTIVSRLAKCEVENGVQCLENMALIRNSQRCQYKDLLWRHCLNPIFRKDTFTRDDPELELTVNSYSTHHQVASFVWAATRSVVPKEFLGDSVTWRALRKNISKFVKLRSCEYRNQAQNQKKKKKCGIPCDMRSVESQSKPVWYKAVNSTLGELRAILRRIKVEDPIKLGASVFDYNDIYCRFHQFIPLVRKRTAVLPNLYIVVADVCKAFDTIDQDMLISIMNDVIQLDTYVLRSYSKFICTKKSIMAVPERLCFDHVNGNKSSMDSNVNLQLNSSHCVLIDKGTCADVQKQTLISILTEHLKHNILQIKSNFYLQKIGIPQGSILSSILCCFYYGHLEKHVILPFLKKAFEISSKASLSDPIMQPNEELRYSDVESLLSSKPKMLNSPGDTLKCSSKPHNLLLRLIDDFIFISTSKEVAESFFARMRRGFKAYNCYMNLDKFGLNFNVENPPPSQRFFTGADGLRFIPWSGLLINCETLEIQADYTRYWGAHISSSITFKAGDKPGRTLKKKLCDYMRPKCHPLFYDSNINSQAIVSLNAYQAFLLSAMKFHCYLRAMESSSRQSWTYIFDKILLSLRYMYRLIKKRMHELGDRLSIKPVLKLNNADVVWLGLYAYIKVLKKKQSRYGELIHLLKGKIAKHRVDDASPHLRYAVDDSHSSMFWKIKY